MKPRRAPIVRYPVAFAVEEIRAGNLTLQKMVGGSSELLGGALSLGVKDHIYAFGWMNAKQTERCEKILRESK